MLGNVEKVASEHAADSPTALAEAHAAEAAQAAKVKALKEEMAACEDKAKKGELNKQVQLEVKSLRGLKDKVATVQNECAPMRPCRALTQQAVAKRW